VNLGELGNPAVVVGKAKFFWIVSYRFRFRPLPKDDKGSEGFDPVGIYVDINSGLSPTDINPIEGKWPDNPRGNGWGTFAVFGDADFNDLKLVSAVEEDTTPER
jgi:hypothetical protein